MMLAQLKANYGYLLLGVAVIVLIIIAILVASGGDGSRPSTPSNKAGSSLGNDSVSVTEQGSTVKGRYQGKTLSFRVPKGVTDISDNYLGDKAEQITFSFSHGRGYISAQPVTGSESLIQLAKSYRGTTEKLPVAGNSGYLIEGNTSISGRHRSSDLVTLLGQNKGIDYTIQLSQTGSSDQMKSIAREVAATLKERD